MAPLPADATYVRTVLKVKDDGEILYSPVKEMCNFEWVKLLFTAIPTGTDQRESYLVFLVKYTNQSPDAVRGKTIHVVNEYLRDDQSWFATTCSYAEQNNAEHIFIMLPLLRSECDTHSKMSAKVNEGHPFLTVFSGMSNKVSGALFDDLIMSGRDAPKYRYCESFGLQSDNRTYVLMNCAVIDGDIVSHEQAKVFVNPERMMQDNKAPITEYQFPYIKQVHSLLRSCHVLCGRLIT